MVRLCLFEAGDDLHLVMHLAARLSIPGRPDARGSGVKSLEGNDEAKLTAAFKQEWDQLVLVLDADGPPEGGAQKTYWRVQRAMAACRVVLPERLPPEGLAHVCPDGRRVSVWIFPDNEREGAMEEFALSGLVPADDSLLAHAASQVGMLLANRASHTEPAARFEPSRAAKATLRTWLSWQKRPGVPPGSAVVEGAFEVDGHRVARFADWLRAAFAP